MKFLLSPIGKRLWVALNSPDDWEIGEYTIKHTPTGTVWWVGGGGFSFDGKINAGTPDCLGLIERHILYRRVKKLKTLVLIEQFDRHKK